MSPRLWFATFLVLGLPAGPLPSQGPRPPLADFDWHLSAGLLHCQQT
jgi:hypothetical protein